MAFVQQITPPQKIESSSPSEEEALNDQVTSEAKREFLRLLNLTHVLFLSQAGEKEHTIATAKALQGGFWNRLGRWGQSGAGGRI